MRIKNSATKIVYPLQKILHFVLLVIRNVIDNCFSLHDFPVRHMRVGNIKLELPNHTVFSILFERNHIEWLGKLSADIGGQVLEWRKMLGINSNFHFFSMLSSPILSNLLTNKMKRKKNTTKEEKLREILWRFGFATTFLILFIVLSISRVNE